MPRLWFSHSKWYQESRILWFKRFKTSSRPIIKDWNSCEISAVKVDNKVRIIVRRSNTIRSEYRQKNVEIKFMHGFDVEDISEPVEEKYTLLDEDSRVIQSGYRWVIKIRKFKETNDYECYIWEWKEEDKLIHQSMIYQVYQMLIQIQDSQTFSSKEIFNIQTTESDNMIPVIYQPTLDSWKNFVREIHCYKIEEQSRYQITIIFNDEHLRKHGILDWIYRIVRVFLYQRIMDVESFEIFLNNDFPEGFSFPRIYSGNHTIKDDNIHGDMQKIKIRYYFSNMKHPIVFVNTSNHAMAEHDTNHNMWKWEYRAWEDNNPVILGNKSRKEIDDIFKKNRWTLKPTNI